jgi:hypothetical protein
MKINRNIVGLLAVVGAAYAAGHLGVLSGGGSDAWAQAQQEASAEELAYMKAGAPGAHHKVLDQLAGVWEGEFKVRMVADAPFEVSRGTVTRAWILGGRFLKEVVTATSTLGPYEGLGFFGYNNLDGRYEIAWMESMSTAISTSKGTYHPDSKVMHFGGDYRDPVTGRLVHSWGKINLSDPDRHVYTQYATDPEGRTYTAMEGVLKRSR